MNFCGSIDEPTLHPDILNIVEYFLAISHRRRNVLSILLGLDNIPLILETVLLLSLMSVQ